MGGGAIGGGEAMGGAIGGGEGGVPRPAGTGLGAAVGRGGGV
jgi:hypothetical protein